MERKWWQDAIIYQIYLRSFKDSNNDGIGDFKGLISKLDYLNDLGVTAIWVSPHYESPMDDNGYDISDFFKVSKDYGTLNDVKEFIKLAHQKNMKVIFDLVLNHTSDEHEWFEAAKNPDHLDHHKYHDYYIWQKPKYDEKGNRQMPTQWRSWFGGPVWEYNPPTDEYYLHIFSKKMPDLNWHNKDMIKDLKKTAKWWIDLGVDGFRVDASNHLEKNWDFPEGHPGYENFSSLPKHHEYLEEFGVDIFKPHDVMAMGEAGGATKEEALKYCGYDSNEFDLLIHFGHVWADCDDSNHLTPGKWSKGKINVNHIKKSFDKWFRMLNGDGWNLIYWHNHDHPRVISHYGNDTTYYTQSGKMLAYTLYMMPGTPIIYQGEEIGMTNVDYEKITDFRDVEVYTEYDNFISFGATHEVAMQALRDRSRDNARSPFQWNSSGNAGFSKATPWMNVNNNYNHINLEDQINDKDSIFNTYKEIIRIRKEEKVNDGFLEFINIDNEDTFIYINETLDSKFLVIANFRSKEINIKLDIDIAGYKSILYNYDKRELSKELKLLPYEALVYKLKK
ncbi:MAG: alpha-glucosidase [Candidatus Izimaplasma sp.]|nr:alpha-glucosidase [Candidatus Izimaplasma bacterium]